MDDKRLTRLVRHIVKSTERLAKEVSKDSLESVSDKGKATAAQSLAAVHDYLSVVLGFKQVEEEVVEEKKEEKE